jgi:hypothetical protein
MNNWRPIAETYLAANATHPTRRSGLMRKLATALVLGLAVANCGGTDDAAPADGNFAIYGPDEGQMPAVAHVHDSDGDGDCSCTCTRDSTHNSRGNTCSKSKTK